MKETASLIKEAYRSYRRRRYEDSIVLLQKVVSSVRNNPYPEFLLAVQYLLTDRFDRVQPVLRRLHYSSPDYVPFVQLELFIMLKSSSSREAALSLYLDALQRFPTDPCIRRGVKQLRDTGDFQSYQKKVVLKDLVSVPAPDKLSLLGKRSVRKYIGITGRRVVLIVCLMAVAGVGIFSGVTYFYSNTQGKDKKTGMPGKNDDIDMIVLDKSRYGLIENINRKREPVFYYTSDEVLKDFNVTRRMLKQEQYNEALVLVNRLLHSNATPGVKERAGFLRRFILDNEGRTVSDISFRELSENPYLYEGILVRWKGRVANIKRKQGRIMFSLMVDYRHHDVFSGIADVYAERNLSTINNGDNISVVAQFVSSQGKGGRAYLLLKEAEKI